MRRRIRQLMMAVLFAALGAVAGRVVGEFRRQQAAGEQPRLSLDRISIRPQDVVPGVVAAMRVADRPWSLLHIPPWFAAFAVNFGAAAFANEIGPLMARARGLSSAPGEAPESADSDSPPDEPAVGWTAADAPAEPGPPPPPEAPATQAESSDGFAAFSAGGAPD